MTNHQSHHNSGKLELLNGSFDLTAFSLHLFIFLYGEMYIDLSFEVEHTIGTKSGTTT